MQFNPENIKDDAENNEKKKRCKRPNWIQTAAGKIKGFFSDVKRMVSRTLFTKYLFVTSALIICSFVVLGLIMATLISNSWQHEKQQTLAENAHIVADGMNAYIVPMSAETGSSSADGHIEYHITDAGKEKLRSTLGMLSSSCGADIFIVDAGGNTVICSEEYLHASQDPEVSFKCRHHQSIISKSIIANAAKVEEYITTDKLGGIYTQNHFIVAVPFIANDNTGDQKYIAGFVFVASSASAISEFRNDVLSIVTIAVIIASIISFGLVYMLTYQQVKPLRQMAKAARKFAEGDFSVQVPVTSENEVGQLAEAFNEMAIKLSLSENMNRSFIANVSHELKTPMTTISGFIDGILDGTIPYEKQNQYLRIVSAETKRLARLVRSMLDLSKIDSGEMKLNKQKFNLCETIFDTMLSFEHRIDEKHIEIQGLENLPPITVNGDADLIHQVIYNLMDNAVKFTNEGGYIRVNVSLKGKTVYVSICNSGIGIPSDELPHIFERFYKTDKSRSFDKQGVGLGLYIVKTIIALHGGTIRAESSEGKFCNVIFTLPEAGEGR